MGLEDFDNMFDPEGAGRGVDLATLDNGIYELVIEKAAKEEVGQANETIVKFYMRIHRGPASVGAKVEKAYFFRDQAAVDRFGSDLILLGIPAHTWTAKHGKKYSVEMPKALPGLSGKVVRANKTTSEKNGRTYHNLNIAGLLSSAPDVPAPGPSPTDQNELPF